MLPQLYSSAFCLVLVWLIVKVSGPAWVKPWFTPLVRPKAGWQERFQIILLQAKASVWSGAGEMKAKPAFIPPSLPPHAPFYISFFPHALRIFSYPGDMPGCPWWQWAGGNSCRWWRWLLALSEQITESCTVELTISHLYLCTYFCLFIPPVFFSFFLSFLYSSKCSSLTSSLSPLLLLLFSCSFPLFFLSSSLRPFFFTSFSFRSLLHQPKITLSRSHCFLLLPLSFTFLSVPFLSSICLTATLISSNMRARAHTHTHTHTQWNPPAWLLHTH